MEATPLSRFLVEAAQEDCDLNTAEGRARMSSNAKPLWSLLPDGALKLQLLGEIAAQVQLPSQELGTFWANNSSKALAPAAARNSDWQPDGAQEHSPTASTWSHPRDGESPDSGKGKWEGKGDWKGKGKWEGKNKWERDRPARPPLRGPLASRADHATRIMLGHAALWETLSNEDHTMLCELPAPHGPLFAWLEGQLHEHGPIAWESLREELRGHEAEDLVLRLMSEAATPTEPADESSSELRDLLNRMLVDRIKVQQNEAIEASKADPTALSRYRELEVRRLQLAQALIQTS
jgi:DNA primase